MAKRRKFTPEFKAEVVLEVLSGVTSHAVEISKSSAMPQQVSL